MQGPGHGLAEVHRDDSFDEVARGFLLSENGEWKR